MNLWHIDFTTVKKKSISLLLGVVNYCIEMYSNLCSISSVIAAQNRFQRQVQLAETVLPILVPSLNCQKLKAVNQSIMFVLRHKLIADIRESSRKNPLCEILSLPPI